MIDTSDLIDAFQNKYGETPRLFRAPGRVNLIGEHTDYNDGFVLPMAIDRQTIAAIAPRSDRLLKVWSLNLDEELEFNLDALGCGRRKSWSDYIEGTAAAIMMSGVPLSGANIAIKSDITLGGGLSSSAALEMSFAKALITISNSQLDNLPLALAGQTAEHVHVGINSGIMDQFTSVHGSAGYALLLDCRSFKAKSIPLNLQGCCILVCNSNVRHSLASSEYNLRRQACEKGVAHLSSALPGIKALRDVSMDDFEKHKAILSDAVLRCCRHVISENARTLQAAEALKNGNIEEMGKLMSASHQSLRDDYKVSCVELDMLVARAQAQPGVLGARLTGGGFGGCTVNLVKETSIEAFKINVSREYQSSTGLTPEIFVVTASDGASEMFS
jgi:galactokinase